MPYKDKKVMAQYFKEHKKFYAMNLMVTTDAKIVEWLDKQSNIQATLKEAVTLLMEKRGE